MMGVGKGETTKPPMVSIGLSVYNGEAMVGSAITAILAQSFDDFELIVSDNASTDSTEAICLAFAANDCRVRYIRQSHNLGAAKNFKFVLDQARGRYYMWAASDDLRSPDFLAENVAFLERNSSHVASTCPNCLEGEEGNSALLIDFAIEGDLPTRYLQFLSYCWKSHGIYYSLMRTSVIKQCDIPGQSFTAADWAVDFFLASRGGIHRTKKGLTVFGRGGISSRPGAWSAFRNHPIELFLPFYRFSLYALKLMRPLPWRPWLRIFSTLVRLNIKASFDQAIAAMYTFYCRHFKSAQD